MGSPRGVALLELLDSSSKPTPRPDVLGYPVVLIAATSYSPVRSMTWDGYSRTHTLVNSSMNKRSRQVVGPNCSICLSRWAPSRACSVSVDSPLEVGMLEMSDKLSIVLLSCPAGAPVKSLESEESILLEDPVIISRRHASCPDDLYCTATKTPDPIRPGVLRGLMLMFGEDLITRRYPTRPDKSVVVGPSRVTGLVYHHLCWATDSQISSHLGISSRPPSGPKPPPPGRIDTVLVTCTNTNLNSCSLDRPTEGARDIRLVEVKYPYA
ncbi:hypothetical protein TIFTF001_007572 [Ficus carica]|uniref:Uncharacterized protein n=1 Tax=Ficus carica TaxID=3494 RepID=A0AA88CX89_FICCA|nr:hypothetical protein TIFTF001_007572 [Ficus carica]